MKNYSRLAMIGVVVSSVLLAGDALLFYYTSTYLLADVLLLLCLLASLGYLIKQISLNKDQPIPGGRFIRESSAFHMQLGNEISDQLSSAHTELGNTQAILSDAIVKLVSNFIAISDEVRNLSDNTNKFSKQIHELVRDVSDALAAAERSINGLASGDMSVVTDSRQHVQSMINGLTAFNETVARNAVELNLISTKVEQNVLVVISTLQFQDMSTQLIEHARMRMSALQEVANEMSKGGDSQQNNSEYLERIAAYNRLLDKHVVSLDRQKANPVAQKDFGTGDIELF
jgi:flagellar hook-basal body complex protein FliE